MIDPNRILELAFDGGSADMYALIDEVGNKEAARILKNADALFWSDSLPVVTAKVAYGTFAVMITIIEAENMERAVEVTMMRIGRVLQRLGLLADVSVFRMRGETNKIVMATTKSFE